MSRTCCNVKIFTVRCPYCNTNGKNDKNNQSFGDRLKEWDNSLDNSVGKFNQIFDQIQGGNQDDELEIGEVFTHLGRMLTRTYSDGKKRTYQFLFEDELKSIQGSQSNQVIDTFDKETKQFLHTYRHSSTLARDLGVTRSCVRSWLMDNSKECPVIAKFRVL